MDPADTTSNETNEKANVSSETNAKRRKIDETSTAGKIDDTSAAGFRSFTRNGQDLQVPKQPGDYDGKVLNSIGVEDMSKSAGNIKDYKEQILSIKDFTIVISNKKVTTLKKLNATSQIVGSFAGWLCASYFYPKGVRTIPYGTTAKHRYGQTEEILISKIDKDFFAGEGVLTSATLSNYLVSGNMAQ